MLHIQPCLSGFTKKHASILAIYSSFSHLVWVAVHKRKVASEGGRVVHSS